MKLSLHKVEQLQKKVSKNSLTVTQLGHIFTADFMLSFLLKFKGGNFLQIYNMFNIQPQRFLHKDGIRLQAPKQFSAISSIYVLLSSNNNKLYTRNHSALHPDARLKYCFMHLTGETLSVLGKFFAIAI